MKKQLLLIIALGYSFVSLAQDKIVFEYDTAGNQTKRYLCLSSNCTDITSKTTAPKEIKAPKEIEALQEEDLQKFTPEDSFSYYPNPVKEELYIKWEYTDNKSISSIYLYSLNGQVLRFFDHLEKENAINIPFYDYPTATYLLVLIYSNGEQKSIKIVK